MIRVTAFRAVIPGSFFRAFALMRPSADRVPSVNAGSASGAGSIFLPA